MSIDLKVTLITPELRDRIAAEAKARGMSQSALGRIAIRGWLNWAGPRDARVEALEEEVEHLRHLLAELTKPPPEFVPLVDMLSLTPAQAAILGRLLRAKGEVVPYEALSVAAAASGTARVDFPGYNTVKTQAFHIRRKVVGSGIRVEAVCGIGLRAVVEPGEAAAPKVTTAR
ncbi:MAG: hypothetical protein QM699_01580 [Amaricoccus sp.]|uniref:hypothetical protein n=1 Tax=Amaricoccus sp. TaxID=1872485 RepID=UPI0039E6C458